MVFIGADHGGFPLKEKIKEWLSEWGLPFVDCGAFQLDPNDDFPDIAFTLAKKVAMFPEDEDKGILACRSGSGMVIAANKVPGIRAALISDERSAVHARAHDDVNIASLAGDWIDESTAKLAIKAFLDTPFSGEERHKRRIEKINSFV